MKNQNPSERIAELLHEVIDVFQRGESAPDSPVDTFVPAKTRRALRRGAERLRRGEAQPRYKNLFTAEQLAGILENTARRDEMRQQFHAEFLRLGREIARLIEEDPEGTRKSWETVFMETFRLASEHGPGSEAAARYRQLQHLSRIAQMYKFDRRRQKSFGRAREAAAHDRSERIPLVPAELLDSAPEGEAVFPFPAAGEDSGRCRILLRIGVGASSWIGSFECGFKTVSTIFMMPDGKHLFVSANGAGYILDARSRTLVERTGTEIVGVGRDEEMTLFIVNHNDVSFEAFGPGGRVWKSGPPFMS
ncbi:MAG TPA: hypothetical protein VE974_02775 [Thermoanaerobaculia bacterium]|nr:hypothetical protein [Thermoanaerobaculia bacterium]